MPKKKSAALTKEDLVTYVGPIFEELKTSIHSLETRLTDKINWQGTLMEQMNKKIDVALEYAEITHSNHMTLKEHSTKIESLERDVRVLKSIKR